MEYKKFKELIIKGECRTIDYKIECMAFMKGNDKAKAELAKDIIAFANNGNVASYLIIGVSDDRNGFKSVENEKLTDDNIQNLCKDYIFPIPKVRVIRCSWSNAQDERHKNKTFVIIQIGPNARQCFRFNINLIKYDNKYCFKKNEVWIRREATSDLAIPEEIKRLLEGKEPITQLPQKNNIEYGRLPANEYLEAMRRDLFNFVSCINGTLELEKIPIFINSKIHGNLLRLNLNGMNLKLIVVVRNSLNETINDTLSEKKLLYSIVERKLPLYHGILFIAIEPISKKVLKPFNINIKENWGYFLKDFPESLTTILMKHKSEIYGETWNLDKAFYLALDKIYSTELLQSKLFKMITSINEMKDINGYIAETYKLINESLISWKEGGCATYTSKVWEEDKVIEHSLNKTSILNDKEFVDYEKYGNKVMKKNIKFCEVVDKFLE